MKRHADIYDNYRAHDWLERQHINKVRKVIRAARKRESQLLLDLKQEGDNHAKTIKGLKEAARHAINS